MTNTLTSTQVIAFDAKGGKHLRPLRVHTDGRFAVTYKGKTRIVTALAFNEVSLTDEVYPKDDSRPAKKGDLATQPGAKASAKAKAAAKLVKAPKKAKAKAKGSNLKTPIERAIATVGLTKAQKEAITLLLVE